MPYTEEDLNYNDRSTRASSEQDHPDTRPEIGGEDVDLTGYNTVYLGYPIWWGKEPRILCTFVESHYFFRYDSDPLLYIRQQRNRRERQ